MEYQSVPMSMACSCRWLELPQHARRRIIGIVSRLLQGFLSEPEIYPVSELCGYGYKNKGSCRSLPYQISCNLFLMLLL